MLLKMKMQGFGQPVDRVETQNLEESSQTYGMPVGPVSAKASNTSCRMMEQATRGVNLKILKGEDLPLFEVQVFW